MQIFSGRLKIRKTTKGLSETCEGSFPTQLQTPVMEYMLLLLQAWKQKGSKISELK